MNKKTRIIIGTACGVIIIAAIAGGIIAYGRRSNQEQYQATQEDIDWSSSEYANIGTANRYMGVVEAADTVKIEKIHDQSVKEILVKEGQTVQKGDPLFTYDTDEIQLKLDQSEIDLESLENEIKDLNNQIASLEKEMKTASADNQFEYSLQIQEKKNAVSRAEYNIKSKNIEINQLKESMANSTVFSEIGGVVKSINETGESNDMTGETEPFMTILSVDTYKIKGTINETNVWSIQEGQAVLIRSRVNQDQTWTGTISKIDIENPISNQNNYYMMDSSSERSTNYPFYIELDVSEDLMLGQHVYIELSSGEVFE